MEVVAAVGSFVAIGQALSAVPKIIDALRSIPEAKNELAFLLNELETLRVTTARVDRLGRLFGADPVTSSKPKDGSSSLTADDEALLNTAAAELRAILSELQGLHDSCVRGTDVKRVKWAWKRQKVAPLFKRTRAVRENLQFVISAISIERLEKQHHEQKHMWLEIHSVSFKHTSSIAPSQKALPPTSTLLPETTTDGAQRSPSTETLGDVLTAQGVPEEDVNATAILPTAETTVAHISQILSEKDTQDSLISVSVRAAGQCTRDCNCRCHTSRKQARFFSWLRPAIGSFMLDYDISAVTKPWKCDRLGCQRSGSSTSFEYNFPSWLFEYYRGFRISIGSMAGYGAYLRLSVPRRAPYDLDIRCFLEGRIAFNRLEIHSEAGALYYPTDILLAGTTIMACATIMAEDLELQVLINYWERLLPTTGLKQCDRDLIRLKIRHESPATTRRGLLEKILFLSGESDEFASRPLHDAIESTDDIEPLVLEHRYAIDMLDSTGRAPLHVALALHSHNAIKALIRGGANVNIQDSAGDTSLHCAAFVNCKQCVELLLDANCEVGICDNFGDLAIHDAVLPGRFDKEWNETEEILKMILRKHPWLANARTLDWCRHTPLMLFAGFSRVEAPVTNSILSFLLQDSFQVDLEAVDSFGRTAALLALKDGNLACLQFLVEAGARLDVVCHYGNILHLAGQYCNASTIQYLRSQKVEVNWVQRANSNSWTPWEVFRYTMVCPHSELVKWCLRRPSLADAHAFALLYSEVRDRGLEKEIGFLKEIMEAISRKDGETARRRLQPLMDWDEKMGWTADYETYRVVGNQIKEEMWDAATEAVQENLDLCWEHIWTSPWKYESGFDEHPDQEDYSEARKQFDDLLVERYGDKAILWYEKETAEEETGIAEEWHEAQEDVADTDEELESDEE